MPISFPSNPTSGQVYTYNGKARTFNGVSWDANTTASIATAVAPITYNAGTQAVGLSRVFNTTSASDKGLVIQGSASQTADLTQWQNSAGTVVAEVSADGSGYFSNNYAGGKNAIINGGFDFWQRGTSFSNVGFVYTADRWVPGRGGFDSGLTISRVDSGLPGIPYALRSQRAVGTSSTQNMRLSTTLEVLNSVPFAGRTVTLSFYARKGAGWSSANSSVGTALRAGYGSDGVNIGAGDGFGGGTTPGYIDVTLTTSWQRFTLTAAIPSTATQLGIIQYWNPTGTAASDDYMDITGVQLEIGSVATPFSRAGGTIAGELAACQRYFERFSGGDARVTGGFYSTTAASLYISYLEKRSSVSISISGPYNVDAFGTGTGTGTGVTINGTSAKAGRFDISGVSPAKVFGQPCAWTGGNIDVSAELQ